MVSDQLVTRELMGWLVQTIRWFVTFPSGALFVMMRYYRSDRPHFTRAYQCSDSETYLFVKLLLCAVLWGDPQAKLQQRGHGGGRAGGQPLH